MTRALKIVRDLRLLWPVVPSLRIGTMFNRLEKLLDEMDARDSRREPHVRKGQ